MTEKLDFNYDEEKDVLFIEGVEYPGDYFRDVKKLVSTKYQYALNSDRNRIMKQDRTNRGLIVSDKEHYQFIYPDGVNTKRIIVIPNRTQDQHKAYLLEKLINLLPSLPKIYFLWAYNIIGWIYDHRKDDFIKPVIDNNIFLLAIKNYEADTVKDKS